jgi:saccharopine dehydrogenase (NAD+, L-lysine-forming)
MARSFSKVLVVGLGKVGELVAELLEEQEFEVTGVDQNAPPNAEYPVETVDVTDEAAMKPLLEAHDAVVTCLPYHLNIAVARLAHAAETHYLDLTEDVATTKAIQEMAKTSKRAMIPQCGLAPGFIGIVGASLLDRFDSVRSLRLRVGALPQHPTGLLGYAFNWSPEGVVNEYLEPCEVLKDGEPRTVPPMGQLETIFVGGNRLEAFTTSGGLGTMCETYAGKIEELNYKTMRYPGHCDLMKFFFKELKMAGRRKEAGKILVNAKPPVNDDVVYVHASAEGHRSAGHLLDHGRLGRQRRRDAGLRRPPPGGLRLPGEHRPRRVPQDQVRPPLRRRAHLPGRQRDRPELGSGYPRDSGPRSTSSS